MKTRLISWSTLCSLLLTPCVGLAEEPIPITPKTIQDRILSDNYDVRQGMLDVLNARDNYLKSKLSLLPSLTGSLNLAGSPLFALNSIACVVPFLIPGKWWDVKAAKQRERASLNGLYTLQLNTYAIAFGLVRAHVADQENLIQYQGRYDRMKQIYDRTQKAVQMGLLASSSLLSLETELGRAEADLLKVSADVARQKAQIRLLTGLPVSDSDDDIQIGLDGPIKPARLEGVGNKDTAKSVFFRSPERIQILHLKKAAEASKSSTAWSFINGCAGNTMQTQYTATGQMQQVAPPLGVANGLSINLSPTLYADLSLAQNVIDQHDLSLDKSQAQMGAVLTETHARLKTEKKLLEVYQRVKERSLNSYKEKLNLYSLNLVDISEVSEASNAVTMAELDMIRSRMNLDGHRLTLKRMNLDEDFMDIYVKSRKKLELN